MDKPYESRVPWVSRRDMLRYAGGGFGGLALAGLLSELEASNPTPGTPDSLAPRAPHFAARAKRVIFLFMGGGVSHLESFDPKPKLTADDRRTISIDNWQGRSGSYKFFLKRPWFPFRPGGKCGTEVSDLFPHLRNVVDDLCVIRSMHTDHTNHYESTLGMHTGSFSFARPGMGAWASYGLGTENHNLPSFVVIAPETPYAGTQNWSSDFLPGCHQGTPIETGEAPLRNLKSLAASGDLQSLELDLIARANRQHLAKRASGADLEARIQSFETAFGMQHAAPEAFDLSDESAATLDMYEVEQGKTESFGWQCLIARRLSERGVRFVELIHGGSSNNWDAHGDMQQHVPRAKQVDRPIAALLMDLKQRGLLEETLVVWTTEFGRTPYHSDANAKGREHHHQVFSSWLAGAGVQRGMVYGASDEYGIAVGEKGMHVHDLHATILHLLGLDHTRLTYRYSGRDYRLTDVHGQVVHEIIA